MSESESTEPVPAIAVSPADQSSDRESADANQALNAASFKALKDAADAAHKATDAAHAAEVTVKAKSKADRKQADADQAVTVGLFKKLIETSLGLTDAAKASAEASRESATQTEAARVEAKRGRRRFMIGASIFAFLFTLVFLVIELEGVRTRAKIADCTTSNGACYKRNQEQISNLIDRIDRDGVYREACGVQYAAIRSLGQRSNAIESCVARQIALHQ